MTTPQLIKLIPTQSKIIDFGCGWGTFSKMMEEKGNIVLGIDNSENEIEICKTVWGNTGTLKFERKEIYDIEDESFECVVSTQVIEHVHNPGNYLHECNRILKGKGLLFITLPNIMNPAFFAPLLSRSMERKLIARSKDINRNYMKNRDHIHGWDQYHFVTLVSSVGFELQKYEPLEGIPFPRLPRNYYLRLFRNYCYTMVFVFKKIRDSNIRPHD